jgi:hypothetical protein
MQPREGPVTLGLPSMFLQHTHFNIPPSTGTSLYNLKSNLFSVNSPLKITPPSSPRVPQNGMCHASLTVCLLPLYLPPNNIEAC